MFGMSSEDFWENDPQLYWAYRTFYFKKLEIEQTITNEHIQYDSWLKGNLNYVAQSIAISNAFSKSKKEFPKYEETFEKGGKKEKKKLTKNEINIACQEQINAWARM